MRDTRVQRLTASPVLVGALTVLVVVVAVFLAYNANNGLPFVPTYRVSVVVPDTASLVKGNDVRVGGLRVGSVENIIPIRTVDPESGNEVYAAKLDLKLDRSVQPLPVDSTVIIRSRSALGLKYVQLTPGHSKDGLEEGGTLGGEGKGSEPLRAARPEPVEIDQLFNTFDEPTRRAIQINQMEFGDALAGRGASINLAIGQLGPLVQRLIPVMRNLSSPTTDLSGFFNGLSQSAAEVAPVAELQASGFVVLDETFGALAAVANPYIQDSITEGALTEQTTIDTLPRIRPFLANSAALFTDLQPAARALATSSPILSRAFTVGTPVLRRSPALNNQLPPTAAALNRFGSDQRVKSGISSLTDTARTLSPTLAFVTPAQTVCNYAAIVLDNAQSISSVGDGVGTWLRTYTIAGKFGINNPLWPNNEFIPSSAPANGPQFANHLHYNPYPNTASPGQTRECEAGNEQPLGGQQVIGNPPGNQGTTTRTVAGGSG